MLTESTELLINKFIDNIYKNDKINKANKEIAIKNIQKVFKIMDNFEGQKKLYKNFKEGN